MNFSTYNYTAQDYYVWQRLLAQQIPLVKEIACREYIEGLEKINFSSYYIPSLNQISDKLMRFTGWSLFPVDILIPASIFFDMLSQKKFPVVRKLRREREIDFYTNESPDVFHEYFGHCPLLMHQPYADSMQCFGQYAKGCSKELVLILTKIFWATFEFGLLKNKKGTKVYGAGILPSRTEIKRIFDKEHISIKKLNIFSDLDSSLQGNINQEVFYYIESLECLYNIIRHDLSILLNKFDSSMVKPQLSSHS